MVLGKLPVLGHPTYLEWSRARAYCTCSRCGWGLFGHFYSHLSFLSLWGMARYRLKYCLKGPLRPNQPTNHPTYLSHYIFVYKSENAIESFSFDLQTFSILL